MSEKDRSCREGKYNVMNVGGALRARAMTGEKEMENRLSLIPGSIGGQWSACRSGETWLSFGDLKTTLSAFSVWGFPKFHEKILREAG